MSVAELGLATLAWLGTYVVHSTILLGGIWLVTTVRPVRSPRLRERVWAFGLLAGLATAGLQLGSGIDPLFGRWRLPAAASAARAIEAPADPTATTVADDPPRESRSLAFGPAALDDEAPARRRPERSRTSAAPTTSAAPEDHGERGEHGAREEHGTLNARSEELDPAWPFLVSGELAFRAALAAQGLVPHFAAPEDVPEPQAADAETFAILVPTFATDRASDDAPGAALLARLTRVASRTRGLPWPRVLLGAWILAGLGGMAWFLTSWSRLFAHLRHRTLLTEGPVYELLATLRGRAGLRGRVRLSTSPTVPGPITLGLFRREICVPERALFALTPAQTEAMLAHELGHVVRRDAMWFHILALMERIFFFQPLNRMASRHLHDTAEVLCDDLAVHWTGRRLALASCLTEIARWMIGEKKRHLPVPAMAATRSRLGQRVERLLDDRRSPQVESGHRWFTPVATVLIAGVVGAVPGVMTTGTGVPPRAADPTPPRPVLDAPAPAEEDHESSLHVLEEVEEDARGTLRFGAVPATTYVLDPDPLAVRVLVTQQRGLEAQLQQLEAEIGLVREEFTALELPPRFEATLDHIDQRLRSLRNRRERMDELVERLAEALEPQPEADTRFPRNEERP